MKYLLALLLVPCLAHAEVPVSVRVRIALALANAREYSQPKSEEPVPNTHPERTLTLDWHGVDPPGWHRHGPDSKGEILTHRTHINPATGQSEGPPEAHTFPSGETIWKIYTGPLPPTIVPLDYPLIVHEPRNARQARIQWRRMYDTALKDSRSGGMPMVIEFETPSCIWCRKLESVLGTAEVSSLIGERFIPARIDASVNPELAAGAGVRSYPTLLIVAPDLTILARHEGYFGTAEAINFLNQSLSR